MKTPIYYILISMFLFQLNCRKKYTNVEINDCDTIGNYYENGEHYIKRELVTDDGVIDYNKMLNNFKGHNTVCNPLNNE